MECLTNKKYVLKSLKLWMRMLILKIVSTQQTSYLIIVDAITLFFEKKDDNL